MKLFSTRSQSKVQKTSHPIQIDTLLPHAYAQEVKRYLLSIICLSVCHLHKYFKYPTSRCFDL